MATLSSISPTSGTTGSALTLTGSWGNFNGVAITVFFYNSGGSEEVRVQDGNFFSISSTVINMGVPTLTPGAKTVRVLDGHGFSVSLSFTYNPPTSIVGVAPSSGVVGTVIDIAGFNFFNVSGVTIGGVSASYAVQDQNHVLATVPSSLSTGAKDVRVTSTSHGSATLTFGFTVTNPPVTISSVSPSQFFQDTAATITITGTNFINVTSVTIGGTTCTSVVVSGSTQITCTTPAKAAGSYTLTVTTAAHGSASTTFNYIANPPVTITSVSPARGVQNTTHAITITGTNFINVTSVTIGGTACTGVSVPNSTQITCTTPSKPVGSYSLFVATSAHGSVTSTFEYTFPLLLFGATLAVSQTPFTIVAPSASDTIIAKTSRFSSTAEANLATPPGRDIDTYDASGVGLAWTKSHYNQIFTGIDRLKRSLDTQHHSADGSSIFSITGLRGIQKVSKPVSISPPVGTSSVVELIAHGGNFYTGLQQLHTPTSLAGEALDGDTSWATIRMAFDDTKVYGVATYEVDLTGKTTTFTATYAAYLFLAEAPSLPPISAPNLENPGAPKKRIGNDAYQRLRTNLTSAKSLYEAEHDIKTGEHRIPLARVQGFTTIFDDEIEVPPGLGGVQVIRIESGTYRENQYFQPSLIGNANSGIVCATLGFDADNVFAILRRVTLGQTNTFRMRCYRVDDQ